jgi:hypothetical protein
MGTRCRGLGEILARLTGPVGVQIVTRFQITERKPIIAQIVETRAMRCSVPVARDGVFRLDLLRPACFCQRGSGLVH